MVIIKEFEEIVQNFETTPILFIGSGFSRRYLSAPDWEGLLKVFSNRIRNDSFSYSYYKNRVINMKNKTGLLPKLAEVLEIDFNEKWLCNEKFRGENLQKYYNEIANNGLSPFKAEIGYFFEKLLDENFMINDELNSFISMCESSVTSIITTNYDCLIEKLISDFKSYIGQEELIFSNIQGIAEIYKIHGCATKPSSIVINERDYVDFIEKNQYLSSKLITLFMEYPIIFIGYSINDYNIKLILENMTKYLSNENLIKLKNRLVFIEREENRNDIEVSKHTMYLNDKEIHMTKLSTDNYKKIFDIISNKKKKIPAKVLRMLKEELYQFIISNEPTSKLRVGEINNPNLSDSDLILAIGKASEFALKGLTGLTTNEWYINLINENLEFTYDEMLKNTNNVMNSSNKLPLNKYLYKAKENYSDIYNKCMEFNKTIYSSTIVKNRNRFPLKSISSIITDDNLTLSKKIDCICHLTESETNVELLEEFIKNELQQDFFKNYKSNKNMTSSMRRLIRVYDYLKYSDLVKRKYSQNQTSEKI
ncbi:SIR2 family protein [[Clostridium] colinum]|uniref:SIR2 family protein n=1 Tax=[Clostridium] colinum TaxID=36835 RepID=UPI0020243374|nr:SIR2 family protein [[Clostridium] colinum]